MRIAAEEAKDKKERKDATAVALRLKPKSEYECLLVISYVIYILCKGLKLHAV